MEGGVPKMVGWMAKLECGQLSWRNGWLSWWDGWLSW
jgi:hypothetical protein